MDGFVNVACSKLMFLVCLRILLILKANGLASVDQNFNISIINLYIISSFQVGYGNSQPQDKTSVVSENLVKLYSCSCRRNATSIGLKKEVNTMV